MNKLEKAEQDRLAAFCRSFGHTSRIAIIQAIAMRSDRVANEIIEVDGLSKSTVGQYLSVLKKDKIIKGAVGIRKLNYCLDWENIDEFKQLFDFLYEQVKNNQKRIIEKENKNH